MGPEHEICNLNFALFSNWFKRSYLKKVSGYSDEVVEYTMIYTWSYGLINKYKGMRLIAPNGLYAVQYTSQRVQYWIRFVPLTVRIVHVYYCHTDFNQCRIYTLGEWLWTYFVAVKNRLMSFYFWFTNKAVWKNNVAFVCLQ